MQKIIPFLWFNGQAEEATNFYTGIFKNSKIVNVSRMPGQEPGQQGPVFSTIFELESQTFYALNGGPQFNFTPAISLFVNCFTQAEVDELWEKLTADGGQESRCGWLTDKYGISWQIIPVQLGQYMGDKDPAKAGRVMQAMMGMGKLDIQALTDAYNGVGAGV
ncbi:VOC family protein [Chitinophaga sp. sic0106]|uniref:VOC family protein n=1 Tax=Chitinophaga sp. sic0106 TaxID=2854785 RepID=UPI001C442175|nr:VOC family protein [Chitinophaga sp. sic0106]MBV7530038.1 VOC family protein [Chitinophaga sp. sic0106]